MYSSCKGAEKKEIRSSEIIKLLKKETHVHIVGKIILDDLDFTAVNEPFIVTANFLQTEIESNIFFSNCVFMGKVITCNKKESVPVHASFKNNVTFAACDFRKEVDFNGSVIFGMLNLGQSVLRENACFDNITVWAKDSYFSEVHAEKSFSMVYASFLGNLYFLNSKFDDRFSIQESSVSGKLSFNNAQFRQRAGFDLIKVEGGASFNYTDFEKGVNFSFSRFLHTTEFIQTKFTGKGIFEKTFFLNTVKFEGLDINNDIELEDCYFGNNKF